MRREYFVSYAHPRGFGAMQQWADSTFSPLRAMEIIAERNPGLKVENISILFFKELAEHETFEGEARA